MRPAFMTLLALILAAGAGRRAGGPKALLTWKGRSFLAGAADALRRPGVDGVAAVLGFEAARVRHEAGLPAHVDVLVNPRPEEGMLGSLLCGLAWAEARAADAVLVHPVDHPRIEAATVDRVIAAMAAGARIAVPSWNGRRGHPAGFARDTWPALRAASPERGARAVLADHPDWVVHVEGDAGCLEGVNTPEDYDRLRRGD
jgi:CTP:molybdopterin cytidylyltransferase MocA